VREIQGANAQPRARGPFARYTKTDKLPVHAVSAESELLSKQTPGKDASIARRLGLAARLMMSLTLMLAAVAIKLARPAAEPRLASSTRLASTRALAGASGLTRRKPTEAVRWDPATLIWKTNASETIAPNANDPSTLQPSNPPTKSTAASHATLRVTVIPYGEVWIDGVHVGSSPIALGVTEGNHHVRAISPQFRFNRSVALASGTSKTFVFH
jgi:hypothetical protein